MLKDFHVKLAYQMDPRQGQALMYDVKLHALVGMWAGKLDDGDTQV